MLMTGGDPSDKQDIWAWGPESDLLSENRSEPALLTDQQAEVELPKPPLEDDPRPMAQITGLRRSSHTSLPTAAIPRFGVHTDQEEELAKVGLPRATGLNFSTCTRGSRDKCGATVTHRSLKTPTNGDLMCSKWLR